MTSRSASSGGDSTDSTLPFHFSELLNGPQRRDEFLRELATEAEVDVITQLAVRAVIPAAGPDAEDWAAVGLAVHERMSELRMSKAALARETGLSETTIRYLGRSPGGHNRSTLVAISAVLRWRPDYLVNVLHRRPEKNQYLRPLGLANLERLLHAEMRALRGDISALAETTLAIEKKIDLLLARGRPTAVRAKEG